MKHLSLVTLVLLFAVSIVYGGESLRWVDGMFPTYGGESRPSEDCPPPIDSICVVYLDINYGGPFSSPQNYPNAKHITNVLVGSYYFPVVIWEMNSQSFFSYWDDMFKFWSYPDSFANGGRGAVCSDGYGNLHFVWNQGGNPDGYEVFYTRALLDTSTGFIQYSVEPPQMISDTNGQEEGFPVLTIHNDNPFAVWGMGSIGSESAIMYNYSINNGATWVGEDTAFAGTMPGSWNLPCIASDPNSGDKWVSLAFDYTGDGSMDIVALHYYASGDTWNDEIAAPAPTMHPYCLPAIVVDYNSIPHIVFQENLTTSGGMSGLSGWNQCGPAGTLYYIHRQGGSWSTTQKIIMTTCVQRSYEAGWPSVGIATDNTIYFSTTLPESASQDTGAYLPFNVNYAAISPYTGVVTFGGMVSNLPAGDSVNGIYAHLTYEVPLPGEVPAGQEGPGITWCQMIAAEPPADVYYAHKDTLASVSETEVVSDPSSIRLYQNYPNPVSGKTVIRFSVPGRTSISLDIYDISGRLIRSLASGIPGGGSYFVVWDGRDAYGKDVSSGVYLYTLRAGSYTATKKLLLVY